VNGGRTQVLHSLRKLKRELEKSSKQPRNLTKNRHDSLNKSQLALSRGVLIKGELVLMTTMMMCANQ
jgi:hypothetical protein